MPLDIFYFILFFMPYLLLFEMKNLGGVWYIYLKTENMCLKIYIDKKISEKIFNII